MPSLDRDRRRLARSPLIDALEAIAAGALVFGIGIAAHYVTFYLATH